MLRGGVILMGLLLGILLVPGVAACSFVVNPDGGLDVRIHSIRSGQFGFAGNVDYVIWTGEFDANGDEIAYWWDEPFAGDDTPEAFIHTYATGGSYELQLECHYLDDDSWDTATEYVTVGGVGSFIQDGFIFGVYWWIWLSIVVGVSAVVLMKRSQDRRKKE